MTLIVEEPPTRFIWLPAINLEEFPALLEQFIENEAKQPNLVKTEELEKQGARLALNDFNKKDLQDFIQSVCKWGGYSGVAGRVIKDNRLNQLTSSFREAYPKARDGAVVEALKVLLTIKGFGVSFSSKHLKFLAPDTAVVLDSIISERLAYARTPEGYQSFLADCHIVLHHIIAAKLDYSGWGKRGWRVSDVEMAIFARLRF